MTELWLMLTLKSTIVLVCGAAIAFCLRNASAAARHLVWVVTAVLLLMLPLGLLVPRDIAPATWHVTGTVLTGTATTAAPVAPLFTRLWALGALCLVVRLAVCACRALRLVRRATPVGESNGFEVRSTGSVPGAMAWTFSRGAIIVPEICRDWPASTTEAALLHESAHLVRRDGYALLAGELARALYWFHPLMWYALRRLRMEQEHAADDAVLAAGVQPADYAQHLVELARFGRTQPLLAGAGATRTLAGRIETILDGTRSRTVQNRRMLLISLAAVVAAAIPLAALQSDGKVHRIGEPGVTAPVALEKRQPAYTQEAREAKIEGTVVLTAVVEPTGRLSNIQVKEGLDAGLDQNAMAALATWVFKPAEKNGTPVRVSCTIQVNFRLI